MWNTVGAFFTMVGQALGIISKRTDLKNAPDVQAAAKAQQEQNQVDQTSQAIANKNTKEIRDELSEN